MIWNKANLRDLIAATGLEILFKIGFKSSIDDLKKTIGQRLYTTLSIVHHFKAIGEFKLELQSGYANLGQNQWFF